MGAVFEVAAADGDGEAEAAAVASARRRAATLSHRGEQGRLACRMVVTSCSRVVELP